MLNIGNLKVVTKMMTETELCEADSKLQRDYRNSIISLEEWNFAKQAIHEEWRRVTKEKEMLKNLMKKMKKPAKFECY